MDQIYFDNWDGIYRIAITTTIAYFLVVFFLRVSGKRTLAKMNAYDFVVTIALGSILGAIILNKSIPLAEGIFALFLLILLQFVLTKLSVHFSSFQSLVTSTPTLLFYEGQLYYNVLKAKRITEDEIHKSIRASNLSGFSQIKAIILEPTGDLSIIKKNKESTSNESLTDIKGITKA